MTANALVGLGDQRVERAGRRVARVLDRLVTEELLPGFVGSPFARSETQPGYSSASRSEPTHVSGMMWNRRRFGV
jgi:hypothetical protein